MKTEAQISDSQKYAPIGPQSLSSTWSVGGMMGTIQCPQCEEQISDREKSCPHCGFSVGVAKLGRYLEGYQKLHPKTFRVVKFLFILLILSVVLWLLARR